MPSLSAKIHNRLKANYIISDFIMSNVAIFVYNMIRADQTEWIQNVWTFYHLWKVWLGQIFFPMFMMGVFWLSGYYNNVNSRSRAQELITTFWSSFIISISVFFMALINDMPQRRLPAIENIFFLTFIIFSFVYLGRYLITRLEVRAIHSHAKFQRTLILGTDEQAVALAKRINSGRKGSGMKVTGLVKLYPDDVPESGSEDFDIVEFEQLPELCEHRAIPHIILSPKLNHNRIEQTRLLRTVFPLDIAVYINPDVDMVHGIAAKRSFNVVGEPLICISSANISASSANVKRLFDIFFSSLALVILSPVYAAIAIAIKLDDGGPVFFTQERMGYRNRPFKIFKFRTMIPNAEKIGGPALTSDDDKRITRIGHTLRKYRFDELPQFLNVLRGEMSIVGPRPERRFYAEQVAAIVPYYHMIYQVRPGITSWGMVNYGYASSVEEMIERLRYDLIYLENISLSTDLKILLHTFNTVLSGKGK